MAGPPKETRHADVESRLTDAELDEIVGGIGEPPPSDEPADPDTDTKNDFQQH